MKFPSLDKDPSAKLDYGFNWSAEIAPATITSSSWAIDTGLVNEAEGHTDTGSLVRISGGTVNTQYFATNHVVLSDGQEDERSLVIRVREM